RLQGGPIARRLGLFGHLKAGAADHATRYRLVVADRHGHRRSQLRQAFAAMNGAPAEGKPEEAAFGVRYVDRHAAPMRLVDDDAGMGIELLVPGGRLGEELLVDRVLALDGEDRHPVATKLLVERDRLLVVMHDQQVHEARAARLVVLGEAAHQHLADATMAGLRVDRQTPQRGAALRVVEDPAVVDAGDRSYDV